MRHLSLPAVVAACLLCLSTLVHAAALPDQLAKAYAGVEEAKATPALDPGRLYRVTADVSWKAYQRRLGRPMSEWAKAEIALPGGNTVFYPFSGPDLVTAAQLFPNADRYVLVAIQHARPPVDLAALVAEKRSAFYDKFSAEWQKFGVLGFFRTQDLDDDAGSRRARLGVTSILMGFAARLGFDVVDVSPIALSEASGDFEKIADGDKGAWSSVRLTLVREGRQVLVDYVRLDLSDFALKQHEPQRAWIERMAKNPVLLKAASHLPQEPSFSVIRDAIVANAPLVVQDETGIDYAELRRIGEVVLYGNFTRPYKLFDPSAQSSLAEAYRSAKSVRELPFSFSYLKSSGQRSLQIARRPALR